MDGIAALRERDLDAIRGADGTHSLLGLQLS